MDWTAGYASDVEYTAGFYREQSPVFLNFACVLNGYEPIALNKPYTYFELGFGRGLTANILAASNPNGQFYAADFNPAHVAGARQLAESAQLSNITLLENSFAELAEGKVELPQFDFITLHGIYTWVTAENRQHIANFIARYLKPGGIVYISYNAMPGWATALPLQRLLVEHADLHPNRSDMQINEGAEFIEKINQMQANYFVANPALKGRLEMLKNGSRNYLVHEYMHKHWQPMYHVDVARDMAVAKLDYIGSADLPFAYQALYLSPERLAMLNSVSDRSLRETIMDYFFNTAFRKDIFMRGARRINAIRQSECLAGIGMALVVNRENINLTMKLTVGEVNGKEEVYGPVIDAIAKQPQTMGELGSVPALAGQTYGNLTQIASMLVASNQAGIFFSHGMQVATDAAKRLNRAIAAQTRYSDEYQAFSSPLLGNGISVNFLERVLYLMMVQNPKMSDAASLAKEAWKMMGPQGRRMIVDGKSLEGDEANIAELTKQFDVLLKNRVPLWKQLRMM
ncbi:MAG: methyltransferase regulatory domain-containing protein [Burkholderiales bacterium]|nr:methyltransferase regulatory domain-containing protein [Burkholderiales bacterium]